MHFTDPSSHVLYWNMSHLQGHSIRFALGPVTGSVRRIVVRFSMDLSLFPFPPLPATPCSNQPQPPGDPLSSNMDISQIAYHTTTLYNTTNHTQPQSKYQYQFHHATPQSLPHNPESNIKIGIITIPSGIKFRSGMGL